MCNYGDNFKGRTFGHTVWKPTPTINAANEREGDPNKFSTGTLFSRVTEQSGKMQRCFAQNGHQVAAEALPCLSP